MASKEEEDHTNNNILIDDEDLEEEDDDDEEDLESEDEDDDQPIEERDRHLHLHLHSSSVPIPTTPKPTPIPVATLQTTHAPIIATPITTISSFSLSIATPEEKAKPSAAFDDSRRLFQRLWTDEDEIGLLQGFLEYTSQRGGFKNSAYHHDTAPFYDQIKSKLQLDFNKNQLVEKLRRLKKKYRNVMSRINSGKELSFKTPHDQATFEISRKIWCGIYGVGETGLMDDEDHGNALVLHSNTEINGDKKGSASGSRSRKRSRNGTAPTLLPPTPPPPTAVPMAAPVLAPAVKAEENIHPSNTLSSPVNSSLPNVIEDTVRSCLSPLFKELMFSAINGPGNARGLGGMPFNLLPLNFGGGNPSSGSGREREMMDEKWRKQQILELEVYSKRVDLVQDQIKLALEELRSGGNR